MKSYLVLKMPQWFQIQNFWLSGITWLVWMTLSFAQSITGEILPGILGSVIMYWNALWIFWVYLIVGVIETRKCADLFDIIHFQCYIVTSSEELEHLVQDASSHFCGRLYIPFQACPLFSRCTWKTASAFLCFENSCKMLVHRCA